MDHMQTSGYVNVIRNLAECVDALEAAKSIVGGTNDNELHKLLLDKYFEMLEFNAKVLAHVGEQVKKIVK